MYSCFKESDGALATVYAALFLAASVQCFRIHRRVPGEFTMQKVIHLLVGVFALFRTISNALNALSVLERPARAFYVMWTLGGCLFFTLYATLVMLWVKIYHESSASPSPVNLRRRTALVNIAFYTLQMFIFVLLAWPADSGARHRYLKIQPLFLGASSIAAAVAVIVYGYRIMSAFGAGSPAQHATWRRVNLVTTVATLCFLARGAADFCWGFLLEPLAPCHKAFVLSFFYPVVEVLPCTTVLCTMSRMPPPTSSLRSASYAKSARSTSDRLSKPLLPDSPMELDLSPHGEGTTPYSSQSSFDFSEAGDEEEGEPGGGGDQEWQAHDAAAITTAPGRRRGSSGTSATSGTHLSRTGRPLDTTFSVPGSSLTGGVAPLPSHLSSRPIASLPSHTSAAAEAASASIRSAAYDDARTPGSSGDGTGRTSAHRSASGAGETALEMTWTAPRGARAQTEGVVTAPGHEGKHPAGPQPWPENAHRGKRAGRSARAASRTSRGSSARGSLGGDDSPVESSGGRESATL